jgi:dynein heavy chain 1, cytosolic
MLHTDRLTFALLLCRIHLKGRPQEDHLEQEFQVFLRGKEGVVSVSKVMPGLSNEQQEAMMRLSSRYY